MGDNANLSFYLTSPSDWRFRTTSGAERMRILSGGQVCIGTTDGPGEVGLYLGDGTNPAGHIYANGSDHLYILANAYYNGGWKYQGSGHAASVTIGDGDLVFNTAPTGTAGNAITWAEVFRAKNSNGDFEITNGNVVIGTGGKGIDFSAQTTSTTAGATAATSAGDEVLDHYEKGIWTLTDASGAGLTLSNAHRWYIRIGDLVHVNFYISYPTNTDSTLSKLGGLPFAAKANNYFYLNGRVGGQSNGVMFQVNAGDTVIEPYVNDARRTNAQLSGAYVLISGCYQI